MRITIRIIIISVQATQLTLCGAINVLAHCAFKTQFDDDSDLEAAKQMADGNTTSDVVCVDDMGKARVMEPILADKVSSLKEQSTDFLNGNVQSQFEDFHNNCYYFNLQT